MSMNVNQDYSQFYAGTEQIKSYTLFRRGA